MERIYQYHFDRNPGAVIRSLLSACDCEKDVMKALEKEFSRWMKEDFELALMKEVHRTYFLASSAIHRSSVKERKIFVDNVFDEILWRLRKLTSEHVDAQLPQFALHFIESDWWLERAKYDAFLWQIRSLIKEASSIIDDAGRRYLTLYNQDKEEFERRLAELDKSRRERCDRHDEVCAEVSGPSDDTLATGESAAQIQ